MNSDVDIKSKITSAQRTLERVLGKGDTKMSFKYIMISIKIVAKMGWEKNKNESWDHVDSCLLWSHRRWSFWGLSDAESDTSVWWYRSKHPLRWVVSVGSRLMPSVTSVSASCISLMSSCKLLSLLYLPNTCLAITLTQGTVWNSSYSYNSPQRLLSFPVYKSTWS